MKLQTYGKLSQIIDGHLVKAISKLRLSYYYYLPNTTFIEAVHTHAINIV
jgi:hypothetical protein